MTLAIRHRLASEVPPPPKTIVLTPKAQLWAQYYGLNNQSAAPLEAVKAATELRDAYLRAKAEEGLKKIPASELEKMIQNALRLALPGSLKEKS